MSGPRDFIDIVAVARILGRSPVWVLRHRADLEKDLGFPPPVLGGGMASMRWDPEAIRLWQNAKIPVALRRETVAADDNAAVAITLAERAEALASRH